MAMVSYAQKLREINWDRVRVATFYMKSGSKLKVRPKKDQHLEYTPNGDMIFCQDDDPSTWAIPVTEVEAVFINLNESED